jgi:hypothetical protein
MGAYVRAEAAWMLDLDRRERSAVDEPEAKPLRAVAA